MDNIQKDSQIFAIKEVRIESNPEGKLTVELLVAGLIFTGGKEDV